MSVTRMIVLMMALALSACGGAGDGGTGPGASGSVSAIAGTYQLTAVGGTSLPHEMGGYANVPGQGTNLTELMAASMTVHSDGSYLVSETTEQWDGRTYSAPSYPQSSGTVTVSGGRATFAGGLLNLGTATTGSASVLGVSVGGVIWTWSR